MRNFVRMTACLIGALALPTSAAAEGVSNFSMVGFPVGTEDVESMHRSVQAYGQECEVFQLDEDDYACAILDESGGQMWIGLRMEGEDVTLFTANPAFAGKSVFPVTVLGLVSDPEWEPFEYKLSVKFSELEIPLLVEVADPREAARFTDVGDGVEMDLDLTGFVFSPQFYKSFEEYEAAQKAAGAESIFAEDHFIPSGLFGDQPTAHAMFGGKVKQIELVENERKEQHWWALVEVLEGATVNVVFDTSSVTEPPEVGDLVVGSYWLSAKTAGDL